MVRVVREVKEVVKLSRKKGVPVHNRNHNRNRTGTGTGFGAIPSSKAVLRRGNNETNTNSRREGRSRQGPDRHSLVNAPLVSSLRRVQVGGGKCDLSRLA